MENRDAVEEYRVGRVHDLLCRRHVTQKEISILEKQLQLCLRFLRLLVKLPK